MHSASFTPLSFIASQLKGEISIAFTVNPFSCRASVWQPLPAPISSTRPLASCKAFCSSTGISRVLLKRWVTGISSSSNIEESTLSRAAFPCFWKSRMAAPIGSLSADNISVFIFFFSICFISSIFLFYPDELN